MTPAETAEKIAGMLRGMGLESRTVGCPEWVAVCAGGGSDEWCVFRVRDEKHGHVISDTLRLMGSATLARRVYRHDDERSIRKRCEDIVGRYQALSAYRAGQKTAWAVADDLKKVGMVATARGGRVVITLSLSPECAAKVGPKIAAVMSERGGTASAECLLDLAARSEGEP